MDRGAWWATVHGVTKSRTRLKRLSAHQAILKCCGQWCFHTCWMASLTRWTWVWVDSRSWCWTGRPGVLRFMGLQRVGHDWATELNWTDRALRNTFFKKIPKQKGIQLSYWELVPSACHAAGSLEGLERSLFPSKWLGHTIKADSLVSLYLMYIPKVGWKIIVWQRIAEPWGVFSFLTLPLWIWYLEKMLDQQPCIWNPFIRETNWAAQLCLLHQYISNGIKTFTWIIHSGPWLSSIRLFGVLDNRTT